MSSPHGAPLPDLLIRADDHVGGLDTAPLTLVAYCDFECPYCGQLYPVIKRLRAALPERLRYVFRHFPLADKHPFAEQAAEATEAADAQRQFWPMHDLLFEHQDALEVEDLLGYAEFLGIQVDQFAQELSARTYAKRVQEDVLSGRRNGVRGTPTCYLNGRQTDQETLEELVLRLGDNGGL
jgi:protein-disulfide isomerase